MRSPATIATEHTGHTIYRTPQTLQNLLTISREINKLLASHASGGVSIRLSESLLAALVGILRSETGEEVKKLRPALKNEDVATHNSYSQSDDFKRVLNDKEVEILSLVAMGNSNKQIAKCTALSVRTVEFYRLSAMRKLDIYKLPQLVIYAARHGLINPYLSKAN